MRKRKSVVTEPAKPKREIDPLGAVALYLEPVNVSLVGEEDDEDIKHHLVFLLRHHEGHRREAARKELVRLIGRPIERLLNAVEHSKQMAKETHSPETVAYVEEIIKEALLRRTTRGGGGF